MAPEQPACPQCGRPAAIPVPPVPGMGYLVENYASKVKTLGVFWIGYGVLNLVFGLIGVAFLRPFASRWSSSWCHRQTSLSGPCPGAWAHSCQPTAIAS